MNEQPLATWADYRAAVTRFLSAVDSVLEQGATAQRNCDQFFKIHGVRVGSGAEALTSDTLPPEQRRLHGDLLDLLERLYDEQARTPVARGLRVSARTASLALNQRTRI